MGQYETHGVSGVLDGLEVGLAALLLSGSVFLACPAAALLARAACDTTLHDGLATPFGGNAPHSHTARLIRF